MEHPWSRLINYAAALYDHAGREAAAPPSRGPSADRRTGPAGAPPSHTAHRAAPRSCGLTAAGGAGLGGRGRAASARPRPRRHPLIETFVTFHAGPQRLWCNRHSRRSEECKECGPGWIAPDTVKITVSSFLLFSNCFLLFSCLFF